MKYARQCSITGKGMNKGFCICDGDMHIKYEIDMIQHITDETGYDTIEEAYEDEYYYWTEWECETDLQYEEINGVLTEILNP
jgi:hypothetical protein